MIGKILIGLLIVAGAFASFVALFVLLTEPPSQEIVDCEVCGLLYLESDLDDEGRCARCRGEQVGPY